MCDPDSAERRGAEQRRFVSSPICSPRTGNRGSIFQEVNYIAFIAISIECMVQCREIAYFFGHWYCFLPGDPGTGKECVGRG